MARDPTTVTCDPDADTPGSPNAHFSFSFGTSVADSPAAAADWNRVLRRSPPHPFQDAPVSCSRVAAGFALQNAVFAIASSGARYEPAARPVTNAATARRSAGDSVAPWRRMLKELSAVSTASGEKPLSAARFGMRGSDPSWQPAQCCL